MFSVVPEKDQEAWGSWDESHPVQCAVGIMSLVSSCRDSGEERRVARGQNLLRRHVWCICIFGTWE